VLFRGFTPNTPFSIAHVVSFSHHCLAATQFSGRSAAASAWLILMVHWVYIRPWQG